MKIVAATLAAFVAIGFDSAGAGEAANKAGERLPRPLETVAWDLGVLEKHFKVVECKYYAADEFTAGNRVVAEETIVWTLEAKEPLRAREVFDLLHPSPPPSPFYKVRFTKTVDGKEVAADAREKGYSLIGDLRWFGPKTGPDLAKGDKLQVWVHLGKEGSAGVIEQNATRLTVKAK